MKLKLNELEEALQNPAEFRMKLAKRAQNIRTDYYSASYFMKLRDAIFRYHKSESEIEGYEYLEDKLAEFKNDLRKQEILEQYNWYVGEYLASHRVHFRCRQNISIKLRDDLIISGQVSRLDLKQPSGYEAWIFCGREPEDWSQQMRMPLIQEELAKSELHVGVSEITIGIYVFDKQLIDQRCYSAEEIADAHRRLDTLLCQLGLA